MSNQLNNKRNISNKPKSALFNNLSNIFSGSYELNQCEPCLHEGKLSNATSFKNTHVCENHNKTSER